MRICYQTLSKRKMKFMVSYVLDPRATSCCYLFRVSRPVMLLLAVRHHLIPIGPYYLHYWNHILRRRICKKRKYFRIMAEKIVDLNVSRKKTSKWILSYYVYNFGNGSATHFISKNFQGFEICTVEFLFSLWGEFKQK